MKKLVVEFDVTDLSEGEVNELTMEVIAQGEESDGQGGKHYRGVPGRWSPGHPSTPILGSEVIRTGGRSRLVVEFDATGLTKDQIGWLTSEVVAQAESSEEHPSVDVTSEIRRK
jgi:hypothetical protein